MELQTHIHISINNHYHNALMAGQTDPLLCSAGAARQDKLTDRTGQSTIDTTDNTAYFLLASLHYTRDTAGTAITTRH